MTTSDGPDHFDVVTFHGGAAHAAPDLPWRFYLEPSEYIY